MTDCNCGCSTFGGEPHDADLRHPNPRGCEHAEYGLDAERLAAVIERWRGLSAGNPQTLPTAEWVAAEYARPDLDSIVDPSL